MVSSTSGSPPPRPRARPASPARPSAVKVFTDLARGDGDATELLRRGLEAQNNRPAAVRARRALLAVAEEEFHWWKKPLANDEEDDDSVPEVPGTTI